MTDEYKPPTARDLLAALSALDDTELDMPVVLAEDEEGNGFEYWGGELDRSLFHKEWKETYLTPEQFAADQAKEKPKYGPDDEPPEIGEEIERVIIVWP